MMNDKEIQRLDKILSNLGYGSRKDVRIIIKKGMVIVDGKMVKDCSMQVNPINSIIIIDGKQLNYRKHIYIMMNKPQGVISATYDGKNKTVINLLPEEFANIELFPAGRLDIDTEGFILLTNDGDFAHEILSPKKHVPKTYFAKVKGLVNDEDAEKFKNGVVIDEGYKCLPAELRILKSGEVSEIELTISEGKFHQVKRMFQSVGKEVIYLKRIAMGGLKLDESLELGQCRELNQEEIDLIKKID